MTSTQQQIPHFTAECIEYLGKVSEALRNLPSGKTAYGEFYIKEAVICFDGVEIVGRFVPNDVDGKTYSFEAQYEVIKGD